MKFVAFYFSAIFVFGAYLFTAAVLAQYTYILQSMNQLDSVAAFTQEAIDLYTWATNNTNTLDEGAVFEERILAASLYRLTGNVYYHNQFKTLYDQFYTHINFPENSYKVHLAIYFYVKNEEQHPIDQNYVDNAMTEMTNWSNFTSLGAANNRAFRYANNPYRPQGYGASSTPYTYHLILMYELIGNQQYLDLANTTLDYFLGGNLTDMCWVSGHGVNTIGQYMQLDSFIDGIDNYIPGYSVYGIRYEPDRFGWLTFDGHGYTNMYPNYQQVPAHSAYLENRYCPGTAEYTVHQTNAVWTFNLGYFLPEANISCPPNKALGNQTLSGIQTHQSTQLTSSNGTVSNGADVQLKSEVRVRLDNNFEVEQGAKLKVRIEDCD